MDKNGQALIRNNSQDLNHDMGLRFLPPLEQPHAWGKHWFLWLFPIACVNDVLYADEGKSTFCIAHLPPWKNPLFSLFWSGRQNHRKSHGQEVCHEIKVEEILDWCPSTNSIIGLCQEHSGSSVHIFNNIDDVHVLFDDLAKKQVHFGTEVSLMWNVGYSIKSQSEMIGYSGHNWSTYQKSSSI